MPDHPKSAWTQADRTRRVARVLWVTLILNWLTAFLKVVFGMMTQCMVIVADGAHSFSDGTSNIIGLVGIRLSGHPADRDHPYGHQKYETLAATGIAFLLLAVAFGIFQKAWDSFAHPMHPEVSAASFLVMGLTFVVNLFVVWFERKRGRELQSELLLSDSWHTLTDIFVTLTVLVALVGIRLEWRFLDAIFSFAIGGIIVAVAFGIFKRSSDVLVDHAVLDAAEIEKIVRRVDGVLDCHEIRSRGRSHEIYVDLHVLVDPRMSVEASHRLANVIEKDLRTEIHGVHDVVVHIEPVSHEHDGLEEGK